MGFSPRMQRKSGTIRPRDCGKSGINVHDFRLLYQAGAKGREIKDNICGWE